ncbi:MAG: glutaredoxin domain-containing protein [Chloroflexota bacterium]
MVGSVNPQVWVIIFTTPNCAFCNAPKQYFRQRSIRFRDVEVGRDPAAARDRVRRSG